MKTEIRLQKFYDFLDANYIYIEVTRNPNFKLRKAMWTTKLHQTFIQSGLDTEIALSVECEGSTLEHSINRIIKLIDGRELRRFCKDSHGKFWWDEVNRGQHIIKSKSIFNSQIEVKK